MKNLPRSLTMSLLILALTLGGCGGSGGGFDFLGSSPGSPFGVSGTVTLPASVTVGAVQATIASTAAGTGTSINPAASGTVPRAMTTFTYSLPGAFSAQNDWRLCFKVYSDTARTQLTHRGCYDGTTTAPINLEGAAKTFAVTADKTGIDFGVGVP